jgi:SAM-dependent methyltransferase
MTRGWEAARSQRELYDKVAGKYDRSIPPHIANHYLEKRVRLIKEKVGKGLFLDVGCGTGTLARALAKEGFTTVGMDLSSEMLQRGREKGSKRLICGSATHLPFQSGTFDSAASIVVLHHLVTEEKVKACLEEMYRVVSPGGHLIVWDHNPKNLYWRILMKRLPQDSGEERLVDTEEILSGIGKDRIRSIEVTRRGFVPDFVPKCLLGPASRVEQCAEKVPILREFAAHNVIIIQK